MLVLLYIALLGILLHKAERYFAYKRIIKNAEKLKSNRTRNN